MDVITVIALSHWIHAAGYPQQSNYTFNPDSDFFYSNTNTTENPIQCVAQGHVLVVKRVTGSSDDSLPWSAAYATLEDLSESTPWYVNLTLPKNKRVHCWNSAQREIGSDKCTLISGGVEIWNSFRNRDWQDGYVYTELIRSAR